MGRPLKGSKRFRNGFCEVGLPIATGSKERVERRFKFEEDADRWLEAGRIALKTNSPIPSSRSFQVSQPYGRTEEHPPSFAEVAYRWRDMAYHDLRRAQPERARRVDDMIRLHLVPWFGPRTSTIADLEHGQQMSVNFVLHLAGREPSVKVFDHDSVVSGRVLSVVEAAQLIDRKPQTVRRHWLEGRFPAAYRDERGKIWIPEANLSAQFLRRDDTKKFGLAKSYANDILWALRQIVGFAIANGWLTNDPTQSVTTVEPDAAVARSQKRKARPRAWTLNECQALASHLHAVHQLALWLQRILGVRIGEAYGPRVGDILDLDTFGALVIERQGGRTFLVRDDSGQVVTTAEKKKLKTQASCRVVPLPQAMMDLTRIVVKVFHTDSVTGKVDLDARLIPGLQKANVSGQAGFRNALEGALSSEGMSSEDMDARMSPHGLRKSLTTDLAWNANLTELAKRRYVGHVAGEDIYARSYTLDTPDLRELRKIAEEMQLSIEAQLGGTLIVPTTRPPRFGANNPLRNREDEIDFLLAEFDWLVEPGDAGDPYCDTRRVAQELNVEEKVARRIMKSGHLPTIVIAKGNEVPRRHVRLSAVLAERDRLKARTTLPDAASGLGMGYHELYTMIRRLELSIEKDSRTDEYILTSHDVDMLRNERDRIEELYKRSMKASEAATLLKKAHSSLGVMLSRNELCLDKESDASGTRFITRSSVAAHLDVAPKEEVSNCELVPLADVVSMTGIAASLVMTLIQTGKLKRKDVNRRCHVTLDSLEQWLQANGLTAQ